jgi:hypothetical protein
MMIAAEMTCRGSGSLTTVDPDQVAQGGAMRRLLVFTGAFASAVFAMIAFTVPAWAGSPHFVANSITATRTDSSLIVAGKEAGLGDELQVNIQVTATALCINGGGNHPKAVNKASVSAEGQFPVQNGKADFSLTLTATFQPPCSPPMTVEFTDVTITDLTNSISTTLPGTF